MGNIIDPIFIGLGFCQSLGIIIRYRPSVVVSAGAFVSVSLLLVDMVTACFGDSLFLFLDVL